MTRLFDFQIREHTVAAKPVFAMIEFADGIHITDREWSDPQMQRYMKAASLAIFIVNDYFSFEKESKQANGDYQMLCNCVTVSITNEGLTVREAYRKTAELNDKYEREVIELRDKLLLRDDLSPDAKKFVDRVEYVTGGNFRVHTSIKPYKSAA